jgi:catalase
MKEAAIPVLIAAAISLLAITSKADEATTPDAVVDAINGVFGVHKGARAVHAKGTVLTGTFTASADAAALTTAPHLQAGASVPVTVRFSNFAGVPAIPDNDSHASPRGMAVKFKLADGSDADIVAHSFNGFPAATTSEFRQLLVAIGTSKPDTPKPTPLDTFLGDHPVAKAFLTAVKPNPVSFASLPYYAVNAFKLTNKDGKATFVRYQIVPSGGEHYLNDEEAKAASASYLSDEIKKRVGEGPVNFNLVAQVADTGDKVDDPSIAWPADRKTVSLGTISVTKSAGDDAANADLVFMPNAVPAGIEAADPMVADRAAAYAVSFARRHP